ncbi:MAG: hypothetical protein HYY06_23690 [Deltaproteobacteria bacterium]|nr:hypothetical protein [Deltaproteobacteria bacterium]
MVREPGRSAAAFGWPVFVLLASLGCEPPVTDRDAGAEAADGGACSTPPPTTAVDLLFMIDNSSSMGQEQSCASQGFTAALSTLVDRSGDGGTPGEVAVTDLHIGVVSSDMGTAGYSITTCREPTDGDDGMLLHEPSTLVGGCDPSYPTFLSWSTGDDTEALQYDFDCISILGTGGCGFEQQLAAVREALTTHAAGANSGFLREDSVLAVVLLTDEEDCSIRTDGPTDIFDTSTDLGPLNLRCFNHRDEYVEPVSSFVSDLVALRPCAPERLVVAAIAGIPPDSGCNLSGMTDADFQCVLDHPAMQEVIDESPAGQGERLTPSCDVPGLGQAFPPRRIVELVRGVRREGASGTVQSICDADLSPAMREIARVVRSRLGR